VISASGKTEESLKKQIDVTASVVQRSRARMSSDERKTFILTELENLKTAGLNGLERKKTGKKTNYNNFMCDSVVKL